jgi:hypothetical protein
MTIRVQQQEEEKEKRVRKIYFCSLFQAPRPNFKYYWDDFTSVKLVPDEVPPTRYHVMSREERDLVDLFKQEIAMRNQYMFHPNNECVAER